MKVSLLVTTYGKDKERLPLRRWIEGDNRNGGLLRYYDRAKSPAILARSGLRLSSLAQARSSKGKIYRDADFIKYRNDNPFNPGPMFFRSATAPAVNVANGAATPFQGPLQAAQGYQS